MKKEHRGGVVNWVAALRLAKAGQAEELAKLLSNGSQDVPIVVRSWLAENLKRRRARGRPAKLANSEEALWFIRACFATAFPEPKRRSLVEQVVRNGKVIGYRKVSRAEYMGHLAKCYNTSVSTIRNVIAHRGRFKKSG